MSSRRRLGVSVGVATVLLFSGCATDPVPPSTAQLTKAPSVTFQQIGVDQVRAGASQVVTATRDLGVALTRARSENAGANRVVSPWSAMTALAMVRAGAGGTTADEMDRVLGPYQPAALAALIGQLDTVGGDPGTVDENNPPTPPVYRQGTGLFAQKSFPLGKQYLVELSKRFDTGVYPVDFATPQAAEAINEWITVNTGGQITQAPVPPDPRTAMSLLSSVYLGAAWERPFTQTVDDGVFTTAPGRTVSTAMMTQTDDFRLMRGAGWSALELPYGGGGLAMQVVLPNEGTSVDSVLSDAVMGAVSDGLKQARPREVSVTMPRWKTAQSLDLQSVLEDLGVRKIFTDDADLTAISKDVSVSGAAQSATITVGEKGTVAAAVTQIPTITGLPGAPPESFDADRPFVYQIVDTSTSLPLFLGVVANPTAN